MAKTSQQLPVTVRSILQRAGRKLPEGQQLLRARPGVQEREIGAFYIVDRTKGVIADSDDDLAALARRTGLLEPWERIDDS